jgi:16S rRNA (uracil1498-N3)-methyltransferase
MARRYHVSPLPPEGTHRLPPDVAHHLAHVMRARVGEPVVLFDGAGHECHGELVQVQRRLHHEAVVEARLGEPVPSQREPGTQVEVAFAVPKGQRSDWTFEHGTEVGIRRFRPLTCARSPRPPADGARAVRRLERWRRICQAAAGQCDRSLVPDVAATESLENLLGSGSLPGLPAERYLAHADAPPLGPASSNHVLLLVGPAGGFTADEIQAACAAGFAPKSLGPLTLRTETAVLAGALRLMAAD